MKYCLPYSTKIPSHIYKEIDEIEIVYRKEDTTLPAFLEEYLDKIIILTSTSINDIDRLEILAEKYDNFKLKIDVSDQELLFAVKERNIPFFCSFLATTWDQYIGLLDLEPTDIYIGNELCFELNKVSDIAYDSDTQIRVIPNIAQSSWTLGENDENLLSFFIRPEDVSIYDEYVDVFEFSAPIDKVLIYYNIYAKTEKWFGPLNEIIIGLNSNIDNRGLVPAFGYYRAKCAKRCLKGQSCNICMRAQELSKTLLDKNLIVNI